MGWQGAPGHSLPAPQAGIAREPQRRHDQPDSQFACRMTGSGGCEISRERGGEGSVTSIFEAQAEGGGERRSTVESEARSRVLL